MVMKPKALINYIMWAQFSNLYQSIFRTYWDIYDRAFLATIVNGFQLLSISERISILDVWHGSQ